MEPLTLRLTDALVIVDPQNDFLPGGALPVPGGNAIFAPINAITDRFESIIVTQDAHPANHCSFKANGGIWPPHCIAGTDGHAVSTQLGIREFWTAEKGMDPTREAYSGFASREFRQLLDLIRPTRLFVVGLATDYCVKATVLDALAAGYRVVVLADAIAGVAPETSAAAIAEMAAAGATIATTAALSDPESMDGPHVCDECGADKRYGDHTACADPVSA